MAATTHAAPASALKSAAAPTAMSLTAPLSLASASDTALASSGLKTGGDALLPAKLSADDRKEILKDESKITANNKTIAAAAKLSSDKDAIEKATAVIADETKSLSAALKNGDGKKILTVANRVLKEQSSLESGFIALDRESLLERDKVRSDGKFDIAVLSRLGAANVLPTDVQSLDYWRDALGSVKTVDFYGERGELFTVSPQMVIQSYKTVAELGVGEKVAGDATLKQVFSETKPVLEKFGVAGLFGEMAYLQKYEDAARFGADMRALEELVLEYGGDGVTFPIRPSPQPGIPTAAVPEPATWSLMLVGVGGLGGALRRRRATAYAAV